MSLRINLPSLLLRLANNKAPLTIPNASKVSIFHHTFKAKMSCAKATSGSDNLTVEHDHKHRKFFIRLDHAEAKLEYAEEKNENGDVILDMWHTEVPSQLQGKGIAKILAKEAFQHVVANNLKMRLTCTYLQKYLKDNPLDEYKAATV